MSDQEFRDAQAMARASRAFDELGEVQSAFDQVERALLEKLAATPITNPDVVLKLHAGVQALDGVKSALRMIIDAGLVAQDAIQAANLTR